MSTYFTIPYSQLPSNPGYTVYYATWTTTPPADAGTTPPFIVCCTTGSAPEGATVLASSIKDPTPPPLLQLGSISTSDYETKVQTWLASRAL